MNILIDLGLALLTIVFIVIFHAGFQDPDPNPPIDHWDSRSFDDQNISE